MVTRLAQKALSLRQQSQVHDRCRAFAIYFLVTNPDGAAGRVHGALGQLLHAASSLSSFASHL